MTMTTIPHVGTAQNNNNNKIFEKGSWSGSRDPLNFWALNANSSKTVKATDIKFDKHVFTVRPNMTP